MIPKSHLATVAVLCRVLPCVAVCCSVSQCVIYHEFPLRWFRKVISLLLIVVQCGGVCCSVLQCVAVCCSVSLRKTLYTPWKTLYNTVCCSVLQCVAVCCIVLQCDTLCCSVLQCVAVCCSVLQCVAVCCSVLLCVAVCCSVNLRNTLKPPKKTRYNTLCCSVLQRVAACCSVLLQMWLHSHTHSPYTREVPVVRGKSLRRIPGEYCPLPLYTPRLEAEEERADKYSQMSSDYYICY